MLCDISSRRTAVVIAECTHITPWCRIHKVRSNSYTLTVYPSSVMLLNTYIDQMQMVKQEDNHAKGSELLVNKTLGQETGAVYLTVFTIVMCSV